MAYSMKGMGKLTDLVTSHPADRRVLHLFARSKKLEIDELLKLVIMYDEYKSDKLLPHMSLLHIACVVCKPDVIKILMSEGWDVNLESPASGSPLHMALDVGNISVARLLIESGADLNKISSDNITPLGSALSKNKRKKNSLSAVKLLLEAGVSVNAILNYDNHDTALHVAVANNVTSVISLLLQHEADINTVNIYNTTPLLLATFLKYLDVVKLLLHHEPDLYIEDVNHNSPMIAAVKLQQKELLKMLVNAGCDVNRPIEGNPTNPLHTAIVMCHLDMVKQLLNLNADPNKRLNKLTPLHLASSRISPEGVVIGKQSLEDMNLRNNIAEALIDSGARVDALNGDSLTPLQISLHNGLPSIALVLIQHGANVNVCATSSSAKALGNSLFHQIVLMNRDIIISFVEHGADFNIRNSIGMTPYHYTICYRIDMKFIKVFLMYGCPYNQDLSVWTQALKNSNLEAQEFFATQELFFKGIFENDLNLVKSAVEQGAVPRSTSEKIRFPLHYLASKGYTQILLYLLERNVSPNTLNDKGQTVLYIAAQNGHFGACYSLLNHGASYNCASRTSDCSAQTPYMAAIVNGHKQTADLLLSVRRMFRLCHQGSKRLVNELQLKIDKNGHLGFMYLNVINRNGDSLFCTALKRNHMFLAESLFKFKMINLV